MRGHSEEYGKRKRARSSTDRVKQSTIKEADPRGVKRRGENSSVFSYLNCRVIEQYAAQRCILAQQ